MDITHLPPVMTSEEAGELLRCTAKTVEDRLRRGDLPGEKFGEGWILPTRALIDRINELATERMIERRRTPTPAAVVVAADEVNCQPALRRRSEAASSQTGGPCARRTRAAIWTGPQTAGRFGAHKAKRRSLADLKNLAIVDRGCASLAPSKLATRESEASSLDESEILALAREIAARMAPDALLDAADVGAMLKFTPRYIIDELQYCPGFPKPITFEKRSGGKTHPRWLRSDIVAMIERESTGIGKPGRPRRKTAPY